MKGEGEGENTKAGRREGTSPDNPESGVLAAMRVVYARVVEPQPVNHLLGDGETLVRHIEQVLHEADAAGRAGASKGASPPALPLVATPADSCLEDDTASAVLFLLGMDRAGDGPKEPCLILNKRSQAVRQAGDLCCPGGGVSPHWDPFLARLFRCPGFPFRRWRYFGEWSRSPTPRMDRPLLFATAVRESFEEMRLNPLGLRFLGWLPPQRLRILRRAIHPMVAWLPRPQTFRPNWEVEKVVVLPLSQLLDEARYARYLVQIGGTEPTPQEFACFRPDLGGDGDEVLWGATFRITMTFLRLVFGFSHPEGEQLPVVKGKLDEAYLRGGQTRHG